MFLKDVTTNGLIEILNMKQLSDPFEHGVRGRTQIGEDTMDEGDFDKEELVFPSGESLPRCWKDSHYRDSI